MSARLDLISEQRRRHRQRVEARRGAVQGDGALLPSGISAVSAWLRNTTLSGNISSVTDLLNTNPAVQAVDARRPAGNADGSMTWTEAVDNLQLPLHASNNGTVAQGYAFWWKPNSVGVNSNLLNIWQTTGGASAFKLDILQATNSVRYLLFDPNAPGLNGRNCQTAAATVTTSSQFGTFEFDGTAGTEATRVTITINAGAPLTLTFSNVGTPSGPITSLPTPTGFALIGNGQNFTVGSNGFAGIFGRNFYCLGSKMAGATVGLLTPEARIALRDFEPLAA